MIDRLAACSRASRRAVVIGSLLGVTMLSGCSNHAPHPDKLADIAQAALAKGDTAQAVTLAEQAVAGEGRNASLRMLLGNAYLREGRFESARQAFSDAIELGEDSSRSALGLVLADLALGHNAAAIDTLNTYGDVIPAADMGLALVMAGQTDRGVGVLTNAIRNGQNTPKVRQNLAYAYALNGSWSEAQIMAAQDVPADKVGARLQSWALTARPDDSRRRVAALIGAPVRGDSGQPQALALANFPAPAQIAPGQGAPAQAGAAPAPAQPAPAPAIVPASAHADAELPASDPSQSAVLARVDLPPSRPAAAVPAAAPVVPVRAPVVVHEAVAKPVAFHPAPAIRSVPAVKAPAETGVGTHLVQLGAFASEDGAKRAWQHFSSHDPRLAGHRSLIVRVNVHGHDFWRVQATGFVGQASANALCGSLRSHGGTCLVMAMNSAGRPAPVQTASAAPVHPISARTARR